MKPRLAIVTTHPIQYNAPMFRMLTSRGNLEVKVFYTWGEKVLKNKFDPGFGKAISWDIPLLEGYDHAFPENIAGDPGSHHFKGIHNPRLITMIKEWDATDVLVFGWSFRSHLKVMRHFHGRIPILFRGDSILENFTGLRARLKKIFLSLVYRNIDYALYVGKKNREYFRAFGVAEKRLVFTPHAIDNTRFSHDKHAVDFRTQLGIKNTDTVFLYAGKLEKKKDPMTLLEAFKTVKANSVHLVIAGNGEEEAALKKAAATISNVHFLPFQNQSAMPSLYGMCDVFVLPSKGPGETWGLAVNEAMAAGKSVIVSDRCGCTPDLISEGVNGFSFNATDVSGLATLIEKFRDDKLLSEKLGAKSSEIISTWSFEHICKSIENTVLLNH